MNPNPCSNNSQFVDTTGASITLDRTAHLADHKLNRSVVFGSCAVILMSSDNGPCSYQLAWVKSFFGESKQSAICMQTLTFQER